MDRDKKRSRHDNVPSTSSIVPPPSTFQSFDDAFDSMSDCSQDETETVHTNSMSTMPPSSSFVTPLITTFVSSTNSVPPTSLIVPPPSTTLPVNHLSTTTSAMESLKLPTKPAVLELYKSAVPESVSSASERDFQSLQAERGNKTIYDDAIFALISNVNTHCIYKYRKRVQHYCRSRHDPSETLFSTQKYRW